MTPSNLSAEAAPASRPAHNACRPATWSRSYTTTVSRHASTKSASLSGLLCQRMSPLLKAMSAAHDARIQPCWTRGAISRSAASTSPADAARLMTFAVHHGVSSCPVASERAAMTTERPGGCHIVHIAAHWPSINSVARYA
jgi:hypothetical protein